MRKEFAASVFSPELVSQRHLKAILSVLSPQSFLCLALTINSTSSRWLSFLSSPNTNASKWDPKALQRKSCILTNPIASVTPRSCPKPSASPTPRISTPFPSLIAPISPALYTSNRRRGDGEHFGGELRDGEGRGGGVERKRRGQKFVKDRARLRTPWTLLPPPRHLIHPKRPPPHRTPPRSAFPDWLSHARTPHLQISGVVEGKEPSVVFEDDV
jgi:hypothetical protein